MASIISICNMALANVAKPFIQDINEASAEAQACKRFYEHSRDTLLQSYPWRFAGKTQALATISNVKANRWRYAYQRPTDCLKIRRVTDQNMIDNMPSDGLLIVAGGFAHDVEGGTIFTDVETAYLIYTFRLTDTTLFPPMFVEALSWQLSVRLAMPLTRDPKVRADAYQLAEVTTSQAAALDANEVRETSDSASEIIKARA